MHLYSIMNPPFHPQISFPLYKFPSISPTSYKNPPMGAPPSTSSPRKLCPNRPNHIPFGHPFLYLYTHPKLFFIYLVLCKNPLFPTFTYPFVITFDDLLPFFLENATHVSLGWGTPYHLPLLTSSIYSKYPTGHLPLPSEFVHFVLPLAQLIPCLVVPPLAQLIPCLVVPLTLDLVEWLQPLIPHTYPQQRVVLSLHTS
jgi:hypothetical protein